MFCLFACLFCLLYILGGGAGEPSKLEISVDGAGKSPIFIISTLFQVNIMKNVSPLLPSGVTVVENEQIAMSSVPALQLKRAPLPFPTGVTTAETLGKALFTIATLQ